MTCLPPRFEGREREGRGRGQGGREREEEREGGKGERRRKGRRKGEGGERDLAPLGKKYWRRHWRYGQTIILVMFGLELRVKVMVTVRFKVRGRLGLSLRLELGLERRCLQCNCVHETSPLFPLFAGDGLNLFFIHC